MHMNKRYSSLGVGDIQCPKCKRYRLWNSIVLGIITNKSVGKFKGSSLGIGSPLLNIKDIYRERKPSWKEVDRVRCPLNLWLMNDIQHLINTRQGKSKSKSNYNFKYFCAVIVYFFWV